jgi:hypothetical protein
VLIIGFLSAILKLPANKYGVAKEVIFLNHPPQLPFFYHLRPFQNHFEWYTNERAQNLTIITPESL